MRPKVLAAAIDLFVSAEEDYRLKDMYFEICRSENIIFCTKSFPSSLDQTLKRFCGVHESFRMFTSF